MGVFLVCHAMLFSECIELVNMPTSICFDMFQFSTKSESVNESCYVHMVAIIFSDHFCLTISKGLLLYALSSFMPCLALR